MRGLRHSHATLLLEAGVDVNTVSERLGHDTVQTTLQLYGHVTQTIRSCAVVLLSATARRTQWSPVFSSTRQRGRHGDLKLSALRRRHP